MPKKLAKKKKRTLSFKRQMNKQASGLVQHTTASSAFKVELGFFDSLYEPRTITVLAIFLFLVNLIHLPYFASVLPIELNINIYNNLSKQSLPEQLVHGCLLGVIAFIVYGCTQFRDSVMIRPHPVVWRFVHATGIIYFCSLLILIPIEVSNAREVIHYIHPKLGTTPNDQTYGEDCRLQSITPLWNAVCDSFMLAHLFGWVVKALIIRDWYICFLLGFGFEVLEITFQHQLKNFNECWWDHLVLDLFGANMIGIIVGMQLVEFLKSRKYDWVGNTISKLKTRKKKLIRVIFQLTPYTYDPFEWKMFSSPRHFCIILMMIVPFLTSEVCFFYIKHHLWISSTNPVYLTCLAIRAAVSAHAVREWYDFNFSIINKDEDNDENASDNTGMKKLLSSSNRRLGQNCWIILAITSAEFILTLKWNYLEFGLMFPPLYICISWLLTFSCIIFWFLLRCFFDDSTVLNSSSDNNDKYKRVIFNQYIWVLGLALSPLIYLLFSNTYRTGFFHPPLNMSNGISL
eukprot:g1709.t1